MENTLKRLLDAELRAERRVEEADAERERIIRQALADARAAEEQFEARIPELHRAFVQRAEARAAQGVHELQRRYGERANQVRALAQGRRADALEVALQLLIDPRSG